MAAGFLAIGILVLHSQIRRMLANDGKLRMRLTFLLGGSGGILSLVGFTLAIRLTGAGGSSPIGPLIAMAGLLIVSYALSLGDRKERSDLYLKFAVFMVALIAFMWGVTGYADYVGTEAAKALQGSLSKAANVIVYSSANIALAGPGISESSVIASNVKYHFEYTGLRLAVSSGGQIFLLPSRWQPGHGALIVLPAISNDMRVEFQAP
jgi:hypothetical protein